MVHAIDGFFPYIRILDFIIPTYYIVISLTFCACLIWLGRRAEAKDFDQRLVIDSAILVMVASAIGARVLHIMFEDFNFYQAHPADMLKFWNGGFVFYGGALLAFFCGIIFVKIHREKIGDWLNLYAPVCALGYALGRVACFLTGCCFGEVCFLSSNFAFRHPVQLYAVLIEFVTLFILLKTEKHPVWLGRNISKIPGYLFVVWLILHALGRIFMESLRADPRGEMILRLSVSTWISAGILFAIAFYLKAQSGKIFRA